MSILRFFIILFCLLWLTACGRTPLQEQEAYVFGTRVQVIVVSENPEQGREAIATVLREFDDLHHRYHAWQKSELSALNGAIAKGETKPVNAEMAHFIQEAQELCIKSNGLFDPAIGHLIQLWGFQSDEFKNVLPPESQIKNWLAMPPSMKDLLVKKHPVDTQDHGLGVSFLVESKNPKVALDFGGYLKGVALDRAATTLRSKGIQNALINIGGNVMALGNKDGRPWKVGIQHPRQSGPLATIALYDGEAIGTSGDYQRYFEVNGKRYSHLLDPRTGYPAAHTQSVTVLVSGPRAGILSDVLSKPIFIAGPQQWYEMAKKLGVIQVLRVAEDSSVQVTKQLRQRLEFIGNPSIVEVYDNSISSN